MEHGGRTFIEDLCRSTRFLIRVFTELSMNNIIMEIVSRLRVHSSSFLRETPDVVIDYIDGSHALDDVKLGIAGGSSTRKSETACP
jgi:hypothetical protein